MFNLKKKIKNMSINYRTFILSTLNKKINLQFTEMKFLTLTIFNLFLWLNLHRNLFNIINMIQNC
jgi:hypothetical protein